jgi:hypothetical protein
VRISLADRALDLWTGKLIANEPLASALPFARRVLEAMRRNAPRGPLPSVKRVVVWRPLPGGQLLGISISIEPRDHVVAPDFSVL